MFQGSARLRKIQEREKEVSEPWALWKNCQKENGPVWGGLKGNLETKISKGHL